MPKKKPELNRREKSILHFIEKQIIQQQQFMDIWQN